MNGRPLALLALAAVSIGCGAAAPAPRTRSAEAPPPSASAPPAARTEVVVQENAEDEIVAKALEPVILRLPRRAALRPTGNPVPFRIADLPLVVVPKPLANEDAPARPIGGEVPAELSIQPSRELGWNPSGTRFVTITAPAFASTTMKVGQWQGGFFVRNGVEKGGLRVPCERAALSGGVVAARWESLDPKPKSGGPPETYTIADGWFDRVLCRAIVVTRTRAPLREIVPDALFAFRECTDAECSTGTAVSLVIVSALVVVSRDAGPERRHFVPAAHTRVVLPLRRGSAQSVLAQLDPPMQRRSGTRPVRMLSVDIVQGTGDEEPIATAFVGDTAVF